VAKVAYLKNAAKNTKNQERSSAKAAPNGNLRLWLAFPAGLKPGVFAVVAFGVVMAVSGLSVVRIVWFAVPRAYSVYLRGAGHCPFGRMLSPQNL